MDITLEPAEVQFLLALLPKITVNAVQPDAVAVSMAVQSLLAKLSATPPAP